jgi:NTP pyrophosphatase (non-canonical NTP hydrolase)
MSKPGGVAAPIKENTMTNESPNESSADFSPIASYEGFIRAATSFVHERNARWWKDPATGEPKTRNVGEMLMLTVSELAEAMEGDRKGLMDEHLPQYSSLTVELADAMIRIMDIAGGLGLDLAGAWRDKLEYNARRVDHTDAARLAEGGKKY